MSNSSSNKGDDGVSSPLPPFSPVPPLGVGASPAPPLPRLRRRRQDISTSVLCFSLLLIIGGWALMAYLDISCVGFDVRDFMPLRRHPGMKFGASLRPAAAASAFNGTPRDSDARDVATEAKNSVAEFFESAGRFRCPQSRRFTREEVAQHHTADDLWIVIDGNVLDVSLFIGQHPGGLVLLDGAGGQDMATVFARFHHPSSVNLFPSFCIGRIAET